MYVEYSHFPEIVLIENITAEKDDISNLIQYARLGICDIVMSNI